LSSGAEVARQSVRATLILAIANIVSTAVLTVTILLVARLLGPDGYGQYTLALVVPNFIGILVGLGINTAVTRYSSFHLARNEPDIARRMTRNALYFAVLFGLLLTFVSYIGAPFYSAYILQRSEITLLVQVSSIFIVGQSIIACTNAAFIGWNMPSWAGLSSFIQAMMKLTLSPLLILIGFGVFGAVFAHSISYILMGAIAAIALYLLRLRSFTAVSSKTIDPIAPLKTNSKEHAIGVSHVNRKSSFFQDIKEMNRYGLPAYIGNVITSLSQPLFVLIILAVITTNTIVGYYQAALNVATTVVIISNAVAFALFSAFSRLEGINADTKLAFTYSTKYVSLFMTPIVFFLLGSSSALIHVFYGPAYSPAIIFLNILALSYLPVCLGQTVMQPFFNGIGKTRIYMLVAICGAATIFILAPFLGVTLGLGPVGVTYSMLIANLVSITASLYCAKRFAGAQVDYRTVSRIYLASYFGYLVLYLFSFLGFGDFVSLIGDIVLFGISYLTLVPVMRVISREDLNRLSDSSAGHGLISKIMSPIFRYVRYLLDKTGPRSAKHSE